MEAREEEMDQLQSTMNKKVKSLENQLEDALEEKHSAVKVCRILCTVFIVVQILQNRRQSIYIYLSYF